MFLFTYRNNETISKKKFKKGKAKNKGIKNWGWSGISATGLEELGFRNQQGLTNAIGDFEWALAGE